MNYDPSNTKFCILDINKDLLNMFILMTTKTCTIGELQNIQHTLAVYLKVKQPVSWFSWVQRQQDNFAEGTLSNFLSLLNSAVIKYNKINWDNEGDFGGSLSTPYEDIVALTASLRQPKLKKRKTNGINNDKHVKTEKDMDSTKSTKPPFIRHFKSGASTDAQEYKIGDSKDWKGVNWYFCPCPDHANGIRFCQHKPEDCSVMKKWLKANSLQFNDVTGQTLAALRKMTGALASDKTIANLIANLLRIPCCLPLPRSLYLAPLICPISQFRTNLVSSSALWTLLMPTIFAVAVQQLAMHSS